MATATYPNGLKAIFNYDQLNRLSQATTAVSAYDYQRDANGNILIAAEANNRTVSYTYDGLDQLASETVANDPASVDGSVSYSLDPVGNRTSDISTLKGVSSGSWSFNADDEAQSDGYDVYGDTTSTGSNTYVYNSWLKLVSMNGGQVALGYNGFGQLVSKTAHGATTQYLIDDLSPTGYPQVVAELVNGQPVRTYTYGLERISQVQIINNAPTASFYQYDGRGTVRMLTNAAGAVTDTYEYDAFGNLIAAAGNTPNVYLYRGERYDADLGLYNLRARWYNPVTGRFMIRDPYQGSIYDPASLHRFNYARANPANYIDPSGRSAAVENVLNFVGDSLAATAAVTAFGEMINCGYYALASDVWLVGQHLEQQVSLLKLLWTQCSGRITAQQLGSDFANNLVWMGIGGLAGEGIGWLMDAAQGLNWARLLDEEGSIKFGPSGAGTEGDAARFGALNPNEQATMLRLEQQEGIQLQGNPQYAQSPDAFWQIDSSTTADVDFMGHPNAFVNWDYQQENFLNQITTHAQENDFVVVDLTGANDAQIYQILQQIYSLPSNLQNRIILVGW